MPAGGRLINSEVISNDLLNQIAVLNKVEEFTAIQILEEQEKQDAFKLKLTLNY